MAKRKWAKGLMIGAVIGLILIVIDVVFGLVFSPNALSRIISYPNFPAIYSIIYIFNLTSFWSRIIVGGLSNIIVYGIIGAIIGAFFKQKYSERMRIPFTKCPTKYKQKGVISCIKKS